MRTGGVRPSGSGSPAVTARVFTKRVAKAGEAETGAPFPPGSWPRLGILSCAQRSARMRAGKTMVAARGSVIRLVGVGLVRVSFGSSFTRATPARRHSRRAGVARVRGT